ncbi:hypothetical protein F8388_023422 [Cannabis sativa]|nr:hypothetical protein G4B88_011615 [Cannabis sativa]KAF4393618.1 hypothetical protein F8388_023422 [Cannabis sativa]
MAPVMKLVQHLSCLFWRNLFKAASLCANRFPSDSLPSMVFPLPVTTLSLSVFFPLEFEALVLLFCPLLPWLLPDPLLLRL